MCRSSGARGSSQLLVICRPDGARGSSQLVVICRPGGAFGVAASQKPEASSQKQVPPYPNQYRSFNPTTASG
jgi:hypothetical protein